MHLLFVNPPSPRNRSIIRLIDCSHEAKADYLWQPSDFMLISALLGPDDGASLIDGTADRLGEADFFRLVAGSNPDLIVFALSGVCWESDYRYFRKTRDRFRDKPFYVIGDIFQEEAYLSRIVQECDGVIVNPFHLDLEGMMGRSGKGLPGVRSAAEAAPAPLLREGEAPGGIPRHGLFLKKGYVFPLARRARFATVTTVWGCPFACSYCPDSNFQPAVRPWQTVVRELEHLETLGVKELFFGDKAFGYPRENVAPLLDEMAGRFNFSWSCYFHPQMYTAELLELMKAAGCHTLIVGIESANTDGLKRYGRHVDKGRIVELVTHADRLGMSVCGDFILGLEHESEAEMLATTRFARELPLDFASFNIAAPLPGSAFRQKAVAAGRMVFGAEGYDTLSHRGELGISAVGYERLRALRNRAVRQFYLRPSYLLRRLRKTASMEHFVLQVSQMAGMARKSLMSA
ncbi:radical SAM protein [Geobacter sp.]|uniref:B12-binding domain-containing radical SAM protein n=1 Tax=Geobacter sp. TaxID=46610 RepID=UPI0027B901DB|nr:radical SAM protein [Geobacter sp.]